MGVNEKVEFFLNAGWHVVILGTILVAFFYFYISKLTAGHVQDEIDHVFDTQIPKLLDNIQLPDGVSWEKIAVLTERLKGFYREEDLYSKWHNRTVMIVAIGTLILFAVCMIFLSYIYKDSVNLTTILKENIIIFTFIGILEYLFFTRVASRIIPVNPDDLSNIVKEEILKKVS